MSDQQINAHPLDGCDPAACYQTMMSERTALITARREAEDNLIKTVIQLSAALLALLAGFITQAKIVLSPLTLILFGVALTSLAGAIIAGLFEHRFASRAYLEQQQLVEDYFQKKIAEFGEPTANKAVRKAQAAAFIAFVAALLCLGIFAFVHAREAYVKAQRPAAAEAGTTASAGSSAPTQSPSFPASAAVTSGSISEGREQISGTTNAAAASKNKVKP